MEIKVRGVVVIVVRGMEVTALLMKLLGDVVVVETTVVTLVALHVLIVVIHPVVNVVLCFPLDYVAELIH